jgi:hypothetical protein
MANVHYFSNKPGVVPSQVIHLRFIDTESGVISPIGGFTLVFRATQDNDDITVRYAFAECSLDDNFCRRTGVSIARNRLNQEADDYISVINPDYPRDVDLEDQVYVIDEKTNTVDFLEKHFNLRHAVVMDFISSHVVESYGEEVLELIVEIDKKLYINSSIFDAQSDEGDVTALPHKEVLSRISTELRDLLIEHESSQVLDLGVIRKLTELRDLAHTYGMSTTLTESESEV